MRRGDLDSKATKGEAGAAWSQAAAVMVSVPDTNGEDYADGWTRDVSETEVEGNGTTCLAGPGRALLG